MTYILMAHHTIYHSVIEWDEFVGVFDDLDKAHGAIDEERFIWMNAHTVDCGVGGGIRRSFYILEMPMNSTVLKLCGDDNLMGLMVIK